MEQIRRRIRPMMSVSIAPALLHEIDSLTRVTGEPRSHLVERLLWSALVREPRTGDALCSRLKGAASETCASGNIMATAGTGSAK